MRRWLVQIYPVAVSRLWSFDRQYLVQIVFAVVTNFDVVHNWIELFARVLGGVRIGELPGAEGSRRMLVRATVYPLA